MRTGAAPEAGEPPGRPAASPRPQAGGGHGPASAACCPGRAPSRVFPRALGRVPLKSALQLCRSCVAPAGPAGAMDSTARWSDCDRQLQACPRCPRDLLSLSCVPQFPRWWHGPRVGGRRHLPHRVVVGPTVRPLSEGLVFSVRRAGHRLRPPVAFCE